jgi:hypothetical protein
MSIQIKPGTRVLIRTYSAGVHFGTLIERDGQEVHLKEARRLWSWSGALSLSEIAAKGCTISSSKISVPVEEIVLTQAIEVIPIHKNSNINSLWN